MKIICRTPVRVNLANGGDTDYYINQIGWGCVINATLSSHFYEFEINDQHKSKIDIIDYFNPNNLNRTYYLESNVSELDLIKATLKRLQIPSNYSFALRTNVPMKSGLGGSSTLHIAMIATMLKLKNQNLNQNKIAQLAYQIERNDMNILGGYQDQYAAAYGKGFNYMEFKNKIIVQNLKLPEKTIKQLENNLLIYYLKKRDISGSEIHKKQKSDSTNQEIKKLLIQKRTNVKKIKQALQKGKLDEFGKLLMKEGKLKNKITGKKASNFAENIIEKALNAGATGYKISGAGGGGCITLYTPKKYTDQVKSVITPNEAKELKFRFQRNFEPGIILKNLK